MSFIEERDNMAEKYKERIAYFLQQVKSSIKLQLTFQMTVDPIQPEDHYKIDPKTVEHHQKLKGSEFLKFTNNARD